MSASADPIHDRISELSKKTADTYSMLSNCYLELENLKLEHAQLKDQVAYKSGLGDVAGEIDKIKSTFAPIEKKILQLDDHKDMTQALVREIKHSSKDHSDAIHKHCSRIDEVFSAIEMLKAMIASARSDLDMNMNSTVTACKRDLDRKIDELPIPKDSVNIYQVKDYVKDALGSVELDAKNAYLSAQNNEMRLEMMEKKIENILIKIKNVELKTQ